MNLIEFGSIAHIAKKRPATGLFLFLKRPLPNTHSLNPIAQVICQHGEAIGGVIVDILHGEGKPRQLVHGLAVIIVPAAVGTEIIAPDSRGVLLNASQLRHIGRGFFVRHIDTVAVLLPEDAVNIIAVLIAAVVGLGATHFDLMLQNLGQVCG